MADTQSLRMAADAHAWRMQGCLVQGPHLCGHPGWPGVPPALHPAPWQQHCCSVSKLFSRGCKQRSAELKNLIVGGM